ncbi:hypothetical protein OF83DRAFT_1233016 [Amylostereum chailletii]|nr:hypothetical protein OF83DRAFT_1233016 [Amylostereum chailletii]
MVLFKLPQEPSAIIEDSLPPVSWPSNNSNDLIVVDDLVSKYTRAAFRRDGSMQFCLEGPGVASLPWAMSISRFGGPSGQWTTLMALMYPRSASVLAYPRDVHSPRCYTVLWQSEFLQWVHIYAESIALLTSTLDDNAQCHDENSRPDSEWVWQRKKIKLTQTRQNHRHSVNLSFHCDCALQGIRPKGDDIFRACLQYVLPVTRRIMPSPREWSLLKHSEKSLTPSSRQVSTDVLTREELAEDAYEMNLRNSARGLIDGPYYQGITTSELDNLAAKTAAYLTTKHPDYAVLAARLAVSNLPFNTLSVRVMLTPRAVNPKTGRPAAPQSTTLPSYMDKTFSRTSRQAAANDDYSFGFKILKRVYINGRVADRRPTVSVSVFVPRGTSLSSFLCALGWPSLRAYIAGTNGYSNGIVPMLRAFDATSRYDQGDNKRPGASCTTEVVTFNLNRFIVINSYPIPARDVQLEHAPPPHWSRRVRSREHIHDRAHPLRLGEGSDLGNYLARRGRDLSQETSRAATRPSSHTADPSSPRLEGDRKTNEGDAGVSDASPGGKHNYAPHVEETGGMVAIRNLPQHDISAKVKIGLLHDLPRAKMIEAEPLTADDWETIADHVEGTLLSPSACGGGGDRKLMHGCWGERAYACVSFSRAPSDPEETTSSTPPIAETKILDLGKNPTSSSAEKAHRKPMSVLICIDSIPEGPTVVVGGMGSTVGDMREWDVVRIRYDDQPFCLLIAGRPGAGKTEMCRAVAQGLQINEKVYAFSRYVDLSRYKGKPV